MKMIRGRYAFMFAGLLFLLPISPVAQKKAAKTPNSGKTGQKVEAAALNAGTRFDPGNRRDPFLGPPPPKIKMANPDEEAPRGPQPLGISGMYIGQVRLAGIAAGENTTAVFEGTDKRAYFLQEKDKLFDGYIKKIEADSVLLIRETKLMSGKVVTQEVVKRLRTP